MIGRRRARGGACRGTWCGKRFTLFHFKHSKDRESIVCLGDGEAIPMLLKFNSKEARRRSKVFETEMLVERCNEVVNLIGGWSDEENVIDVNEKVERTSSSIIERCVSL